ncbi:MAG: peptidoglycan-associated lipoprotein Pal [Thermodesulfovibrionales bacterium]|jgi:peptidoglycan-associated lipoprotein
MKRILPFFLVIIGITGIMITGCAQRKVVAPETQPQATQPQKEAGESKQSPEKITEQKVAKVESKEVPAQGEEVSGMFADVHFDFDKYDIKDDAKPILKSVADYLIKNPVQKVLIEGHCDERGTSEYNLGLGDRRAKTTKDYLISLGVSSSRIDTISYGKEKPLCTEHTEDCWAKNRRAHFVILSGKH